jgi:hypothetical protein
MAGQKTLNPGMVGWGYHIGSDPAKYLDQRFSGTAVAPASEPIMKDAIIKLVPLASSVAITGDYGKFEMIYNDGRFGGFRKHPKMVSGHCEPSAYEVAVFKMDMAKAAESDPELRMYLNRHPELES